MQPVEILTIQESLILRAAGSELLILPNHVAELKKKQTPRDFTAYFMGESLVNRSARKLFEAWLRKDQGLWQRIYKSVQTIEVTEETLKAIKDVQSGAKIASESVKSPAKAEVAKTSKPKEEKKAAESKKAEPKSEAKSKTSAKSETKSEAKKPAAKTATKSSSKPVAKKKSK